LQFKMLPNATKMAIFDAVRKPSPAGGRFFDAVYIVAHGEVRPDDEDGVIILEKLDHQSDPIPARLLAEALREQSGSFVYLNSCSTALALGDNPFAGVAQRLLRDGSCGAVVAMQQPVVVEQALAIAGSFFNDLARGRNFEEAAHWAIKAEGGE